MFFTAQYLPSRQWLWGILRTLLASRLVPRGNPLINRQDSQQVSPLNCLVSHQFDRRCSRVLTHHLNRKKPRLHNLLKYQLLNHHLYLLSHRPSLLLSRHYFYLVNLADYLQSNRHCNPLLGPVGNLIVNPLCSLHIVHHNSHHINQVAIQRSLLHHQQGNQQESQLFNLLRNLLNHHLHNQLYLHRDSHLRNLYCNLRGVPAVNRPGSPSKCLPKYLHVNQLDSLHFTPRFAHL